jgi:hypothetical protein
VAPEAGASSCSPVAGGRDGAAAALFGRGSRFGFAGAGAAGAAAFARAGFFLGAFAAGFAARFLEVGAFALFFLSSFAM